MTYQKQVTIQEIRDKARYYWERSKDETRPYNLTMLYKRAINLTYLAEKLERELNDIELDTEETAH